MSQKPTLYLAGPAVFHPGAKALFSYMKEICAENGLIGMAPLDNDLPEDATLSPAAKAAQIRALNMELIRRCDAVLACISPFRGPGADAGTAWEMGFAEALGKPVIAWTEAPEAYLTRVEHDQDPDGRRFCKQHGMLVEDFGLCDNLMLTAGAIAVIGDFEAAVKVAKEYANRDIN